MVVTTSTLNCDADECQDYNGANTNSDKGQREEGKRLGWGRIRRGDHYYDLCPYHYKEYQELVGAAKADFLLK